MQVYWVAWSADRTPTPGDMVHFSNEDQVARGFVSEVNGPRILVYLFEPIEAKPFATIVHEEIPDSVWSERLFSVLDANPTAKETWRQAMLADDTITANS